jgi:hypothetical protein
VKYERSGLLPSGGPQPGTTALRDLICDTFTWCPRLKFYNPRDTAMNPVAMDGSGRVTSLSLHAEGRAFDAMTTKRAQGDTLSEWCVRHSEALQIQEVIWQRRIWTSRSNGWHDFTGTNPHTDHVHVAQSWFGALHPEIVDAFRKNPGSTPDTEGPPPIVELPPAGATATLAANQQLRWDQALVCDNQKFTFVHQADGNLVLYDEQTRPVWSNGTVGLETELLIMQDDGNLVLYGQDGSSLWNSNTAGHPGAQLEVRNDGKIAVIDPQRQPLFAKP